MSTVAIAAATFLIVAWLLALRAQLHRDRSRTGEWDGPDRRPQLWTSEARCLRCDAAGGVVEERAGRIAFTCLRCGRREDRTTRA